MRRDFIAQRSPGHQRIHGFEEFVAPRGLAVLFKARLSVGRHGKGLLLHDHVIYTGSRDFFSIALILLRFIDQRKKVFHCAGVCKSIIDLVIKELPG